MPPLNSQEYNVLSDKGNLEDSPPLNPAPSYQARKSKLAIVGVLAIFLVFVSILYSNKSNISYVPSVLFQLSTEECPNWFEAMQDEFLPWKKKGGIDLADVDAAQPLSASRFQIINGSLYEEHFGFCWQTRKRYSIWGLLMFLRHYGDQVPDVDFMFDCGDLPRVFGSHENPHGPIPILFSYNKQEGDSLDLTIPDWSFWGWPEVEIVRWQDHGRKIIDAGRKLTDWTKRKPTAFWKGRIDITRGLTAGLRDNLAACSRDPANGVEVHSKDWMHDHTFDDTRQWKQCGWRYRIYAEGFAWSVSMKYGMACGSVMLVINPFFSAFYHPGLAYGRNALLVKRVPLCDSFREQIEWANSHPNEAEAIGREGLRFVEEDLSMDRVYDYMLHKFKMYADLQNFQPKLRTQSVLVTEDDILAQSTPRERKEYLLTETPKRRHACQMRRTK